MRGRSTGAGEGWVLRAGTVEPVEDLLARLAHVERVDHQVVQQLARLRRVLDARLVLGDADDVRARVRAGVRVEEELEDVGREHDRRRDGR